MEFEMLLRKRILSVLPSLAEEILKSVVKCLEESGVAAEEDLTFVEEQDLKLVLRPIQIRKLLQAWKSKDASTLNDSSISIISSTDEETNEEPDRARCHTQNPDWAEHFSIPWKKMNHGLKSSLRDKVRPHPSDRRAMVKTVIEDVIKIRQKPMQKACNTIARHIVTEYPVSFEDRLDNDVIGTGYCSLAKQLLNRWENVNRTSNSKSQKRQHPTDSEPKTTKVKRTDSYGCIDWQPQHLPDGQTFDSQMALKNELKESFSTDPLSGVELSQDTKDKLKLTYYSQRVDINNGSATEELLESWPHLFTELGLYLHFQLLTNIDIKTTMSNTIAAKGSRIINFMKSVSKPQVQNILQDTAGDVRESATAGIVLCIMAHLDEKVQNIILLADDTYNSEDVENMHGLPTTPCIVACGDCILSSRLFMLCIDKHVVNDQLNTFDSAITALMASFYCLNIMYPSAAASTLEFIQRCFIRINPDKGSKGSLKNKKKTQVDAKVLSLINGIANHEWTME